nr:type II toxin-antitoxin system HicB family antitoxin [uncultured Aminipila sp.]
MKELEYYMSLNYPVVILQEGDGSFFMEYTDLPGCMTCGTNMEQLLAMGKDAKEQWFKSALEKNMNIPEPKLVEEYPDNFKLRLPKSMYKQLALCAKNEGVSMNQYILYLLSQNFAFDCAMKMAKPFKV